MVTEKIRYNDTMENDRWYISEVAKIVNRRPATVRQWDRDKVLPRRLRAKRDGRGRWWTGAQVDGIIDWMRETDRRPGKTLQYYRPTEEEVDNHIERMRR